MSDPRRLMLRIALGVAAMGYQDVICDSRRCVFCGEGGREPDRWTDSYDHLEGLVVQEVDKPNRVYVEAYGWWHLRDECAWILADNLTRDLGGPETVRAQLDREPGVVRAWLRGDA